MPQIRLMPLLLIALAASATYTAATDPPRGKPDDKPTDVNAGIVRSGPKDSGNTNAVYWGHLTDDQQKEAVTSLKALADKTAASLKRNLKLTETRGFLIYSDVPLTDAEKFAGHLDRMYGKLSDLFSLKRGQTIWRGKALVFIFSQIEDYRVYERLMENSDPGGSFAMTHCFGDGMVHIAYYRHPDGTQFEHLLVHESVHGFLHRYRSPVRIPSWANEGLADASAAELVTNPRRAKYMVNLSIALLKAHGNHVGDLFTAQHIDGWQYPVAETLTAWMIQKNRPGYLDFLNGIKDGQTWDESLKKNFGMMPAELLAAYGKSIGIEAKL